jgi:hypothetical protein
MRNLFIKSNCQTLPNTITMDAIDGLFPNLVNIADFLEIIAQIDISDADGELSFEWQAPGWIDRIKTRSELEQVLQGLLEQLGPEPQSIGHIPDKREEAYFSAIAAAACRLLEHYSQDDAPVGSIDAAMRLGVAHRYGRHSLRALRDVAGELHRTAARRRLAFWRAAERRNGHRWLQGQPLEHPFQIGLFGYPLGLRLEDVAWLLVDARVRAVERERRLAINTAMGLWRDANSPDDLAAEIEAVARSDPATQSAYEFWQSPPPPSAEQLAQELEWRELRERNEAEHAARDNSWLEFVDQLRKNPDELRRIHPPTADGKMDARLYHLWLLLCETVDASTRYAIDSVAPLEPMLGPEVASAFRDGLIKFWRLWRPKLKSEKAEKERNQINSLDCTGITGISLEAAIKPSWAEELSSDEAIHAAQYATLELNGFPSWLSGLANAKLSEVRNVLVKEVTAELGDPVPRTRYEVLDDISRSGTVVIELMAPVLFEEVKRREDIAAPALAPLLSIIVESLHGNREKLASLALDRFKRLEGAKAVGHYLGAAFAVDADTATEALTGRLEKLDAQAQTALAQQILPSLFGTGFTGANIRVPELGFTTLERLVSIAFRTIRIEEDRNRLGGQPHWEDERDHAEHARGVVFKQLVETPGLATFTALHRLGEDPDFPIPGSRLQELARERAMQDSESASWPPSEVIAFESAAEAAPSTGKDLQRTALRRFDDMQQDLLHGDFAQGATVQALPDEPAVQNWIAERLRLKQGRAYSVEREPHVAEEKEPDVRLRAKATDASVAIEIKVPESWTVLQLEAALSDQLCGRYLRARDARHGILLLVQKKKKSKGWKDPETGTFLSFRELVKRCVTWRGISRVKCLKHRSPKSPWWMYRTTQRQ